MTILGVMKLLSEANGEVVYEREEKKGLKEDGKRRVRGIESVYRFLLRGSSKV